MHRVIVIVAGAVALAACSSSSNLLNLEMLKPQPAMETVRFESTPPGAEAKVSIGQSCLTPCALALPAVDTGYTVNFTLNGYQQDTERLELVSMGDNTSRLRPNPVLAELTAVPPPTKRKKRVHHRRDVRRAVKPKPRTKPAAVSPTLVTPQQQAPSSWPAVQQQTH